MSSLWMSSRTLKTADLKAKVNFRCCFHVSGGSRLRAEAFLGIIF
jgi:hypothetical protein